MKTRAFTLVELLIVVAIIAILAAVAVPNFLEAQTRSKIGATKSNMRTYAMAIAAYEVDNDCFPTRAGWAFQGDSEYLKRERQYYDAADINGRPRFMGPGKLLTTPIAYVSDIAWDYFNTMSFKYGTPYSSDEYTGVPGRPNTGLDTVNASVFYRTMPTDPDATANGYKEAEFALRWDGREGQAWSKHYLGKTFRWFMASAGPDLTVFDATGSPFYDPTNGTVSFGDIMYYDKWGFLP